MLKKTDLKMLKSADLKRIYLFKSFFEGDEYYFLKSNNGLLLQKVTLDYFHKKCKDFKGSILILENVKMNNLNESNLKFFKHVIYKGEVHIFKHKIQDVFKNKIQDEEIKKLFEFVSKKLIYKFTSFKSDFSDFKYIKNVKRRFNVGKQMVKKRKSKAFFGFFLMGSAINEFKKNPNKLNLKQKFGENLNPGKVFRYLSIYKIFKSKYGKYLLYSVEFKKITTTQLSKICKAILSFEGKNEDYLFKLFEFVKFPKWVNERINIL